MRIINGASYLEHTCALLYNSGILKNCDIYKLSVANYMFDHHKEARFQRTKQYSTRNNSSQLPFYERLTSAQRSVFFIGCQIWNELPYNIREYRNKNAFGRRVQDYLLNKYIQDQH